ncbi:hypothetical protein COV93_04620 [Candidatus Woesearchaeota archaeon CG11_big_fil_rev_8_21_14_0_20_43_8]|nr:MAG: hypothetical protein COV93_04620 [Candidatus Woesearchaeota archaeon CG11_big_fil_rev_8_21_14_0_20_43_8]PIO09059.1 MAG: hypothetical protein COT47_00035 [Candidatus Woesearchaeota archaeon CG08_land_8_20_14_0_20_43_7]
MDYYDVLGLQPGCSIEDVKKRYNYLVKAYSPDENPDTELAQKKLLEINEAYIILSDPRRREKYDYHLMHEKVMKQAYDMKSSPDEIPFLFDKQNKKRLSSSDKRHMFLTLVYLVASANIAAVFYFLAKYVVDVSDSAELSHSFDTHIGWMMVIVVGFFFIIINALMKGYLKTGGRQY